MTELFPTWPLLSAFLVASLLLAVTPGPGVVYIVTRSLTHGRRYGLASVAGVALGNLCNTIIASVGLAAVFAISSLAFSIVKYAGAVYLIYLGVQMFSSRAPVSGNSIGVLGRRIGGGVFIGLGLFTALAGSRNIK